ncbi:MAG: transporter permease [Rhodospirillales bacterium]|jgi:branched-chain amino acid transport system substrate-binding protein|nr:transporter permease [Rhodospirillales bacterium]
MRTLTALLLATTAASCLLAAAAQAEISDNVVKIGVMNDLTGIFRDTNGPGSVLAAQMAAEDFAGGGKGIKVEILSGDHLNKPDVGAGIARQWIDVDHVDAIADMPNSGVGLAVNSLMRGSRATFLASSTASSELSGAQCSPNTVQWTVDTWALANTIGKAVVEGGGKSWYFLTADFAFGQSLEKDATAAIIAKGGTVLGSSRHPLGAPDYSSYLLQAQASKAQVVALANPGPADAIKQANEFQLQQSGQKLVTFLMFTNDVHALGLEVTKGLLLTEAFYWDLDDNTRAWSKRFAARMNGVMPSANQAGVYSSVLAYLKAVAASGSDDAAVVVPEMKKAPFTDLLFHDVTVRPDGRAIHPMYLFQVKDPAESKAPWDYYKLVRTVPSNEAFRPIEQGGCPMLTNK